MSTFSTTVLGTPRIGPNRELKFATEKYWRGEIDADALRDVRKNLRSDSWKRLQESGLDSIPTNVSSFYDQMLDTTVLVGALPQQYQDASDNALDRYFAAARGTAELSPLEMTKWFDTNYHYIVPELTSDIEFSLNPTDILEELFAAKDAGIPARPVIIGPFTYLKLSKMAEGDTVTNPVELIDRLVPVYEALLELLTQEGVEWVQIDEPSAVTTLTAAEQEILNKVYNVLSAVQNRPQIVVATYFGNIGSNLESLTTTDIEGIALDLVSGDLPDINTPGLANKLLLAGVVDGRNVWATAIDGAIELLSRCDERAAHVAVSSSCSLLHVPYTLEVENIPTIAERNADGTEGLCKEWLAFGTEKLAEIALLSKIHSGDVSANGVEVLAAREVTNHRRESSATHDKAVRSRVAALTDDDYQRVSYEERVAAQESINLPLFPTTTIGSFPQTAEIRAARQKFRVGEITADEYTEAMRQEVATVIKKQEELGIDVLVHGEPERNDMVQYFGEQLEGYWASEHGWVQSYGTRCVRPPVVFGDVSRPAPMTVEWASYAASLTDKPVKGMLTGPLTMLSWSFVRDDQSLEDTATQVALAIRDECVDLEAAGIRVIQVDEPALRELLPLRDEEKADYARWAVAAFRLSVTGVKPETQIHTHMCYSEFGEMVGVIGDLDADVTSVESARSQMEIVTDLEENGYHQSIGPGVYDIHSPRIPSVDEMTEALHLALSAVPAERLWVNPDCGLKTRRAEECYPALQNMVDAARILRSEV